jgi:hypothetical protein
MNPNWHRFCTLSLPLVCKLDGGMKLRVRNRRITKSSQVGTTGRGGPSGVRQRRHNPTAALRARQLSKQLRKNLNAQQNPAVVKA